MIRRAACWAGVLLCVAFFLGVLASRARASLLHAPHDASHGIDCGTCHQYPFASWPGYVPDPANIDDTIVNFICLGCHDGTSAVPKMALHSSKVIGGRLAGWTTECTDCHDPHFQAQLQHTAGAGQDLYLVRGDVAGITVDYTNPQQPRSVISYTNVVARPAWSDPASWTAKTGAGRGLILVADRDRPQATYEVVAADATTITVAGNLMAYPYGGRFGLLYGQFVRFAARVPGGGQREVRFFAPEDGFVEQGGASPPRGICQVCHTLTTYWTEDGLNTTHNPGVDCSGCHKAGEGFRPNVYLHTGLAETPACASCHGTGVDVVATVHANNCASCHQSANQAVQAVIAGGGGDCEACHGKYFYSHQNAPHIPAIVTSSGTSCGTSNCHWGDVLVMNIDPRYHQACASCHDQDGVLIGSAQGREGMAPNTCIDCHNAGFAVLHPVTDHTTDISSSGSSCARCHDPSGTTDHLAVTHKGNCALCHDNQGVLIGSAVAGPGNCDTCHGWSYFYSHTTMDHTLLVTSVDNSVSPPQPTTCASCHDPGGVADIVADVHRSQCALCHDSLGYLVSGATGSALGGAGGCYDCHGASYFWSHRVQDHNELSGSGTSCTTCHSPASTPNEIVYYVHKNTCGTTLNGQPYGCHNVDQGGILNGSAAGQLNSANCVTCHGQHHGGNPPVAVDDTFSVQEDTAANVLDVLANDSDPDPGDTLTVVAVGTPSAGGTVTTNGAAVLYTPLANYAGVETFSYTVQDATGNTAQALVTVTVANVNDAPVAGADGPYTVVQGQAVSVAAPGVLANDSDVDGDPLTVTATPVVAPLHGTLTLNADGSFTYTHDGSATTSDTFTYEVTDGNGGTAQAAVTITITANGAPTAVNDSYTVAEDGTLTVAAATGVLANDTDPESDPLTAALVTNVANGTLTLNADGSFTYTPTLNYNGTDSFTYTAADGYNTSNTGTVTITVMPVNDAPVAVGDSATTSEDTPVTTGNVLANDSDVDGDVLTVAGVDATSAGGGTVVGNGNGTFTYTPAPNWNGTDTFSYTVSDGNGGTATGTVTITVTAVNDAPVAATEAITVIQGGTVTTLDGGATTVLANDTDVEGDPLSAVLDTGVLHGTLTLNADGTFSYTHDGSANLSDSFSYHAFDGAAASNVVTVTITVTPKDSIVAARARFVAGGTPMDQLDDFTGLANGTRPNFGNWTGVNGSDGTLGWVVLSGATASSTTGPSAGNPDPYVYLESSAASLTYGVGVAAGSSQYLESNVIDASQYTSLSFEFDWNMNVNGNSDASLHVDAWNGTAWDLDVTGGPVQVGNAGDVWNHTGPIDLSSYNNTDFKLRIRYVVGTAGNVWQNDVAVDNLHISGTAPATGTLDILAVNTDGVASLVQADYNGATYTLVADGTNRWRLDAAAANTYASTIRIYSDRGADNTFPVTNGGPALAWDTITTATGTWNNNTLTVTAVNDWGDATPMHFDYNGATYDMTWNAGAGQWELTVNPVPFVSSGTAWSDAGGSQAVTVTVNQPPAFGSPAYTAPNAIENQPYSTTVAQDATDPEGDPITYSDNGTGTTCSWTTVAADGTISGTPGAADIGTCVVRVKATATGGFATADVTIAVDPAPSAVTLDNTSGYVDTSGSSTSFSWSHTVGAGANYLVVGVGMDSRNGDSVSAVSYPGATCTKLGESQPPSSNVRGRAELWGCANPTPGTASITVTVTGNPGKTFVFSASSWSGVVSATNVVSASSTTSDLSLSITTAGTGSMVVDHFASYKGSTATPGGAQTAIFTDTTSAGGSVVGGGSHAAGTGGVVTMSWTDGGNGGYNGLVAVELAP